MVLSRPSAVFARAGRRSLCSSFAAVDGLLGCSKASLDFVKGDLGELALYVGRHFGPEGGQVLHVGGGDRAVAIGEEGRCPQERPGPGPEATRMASVAIGDVVAESMMEGVRGDLELTGGGAPEVVAEVVCPLAVDLMVAIFGFWRGLTDGRGRESRGRGNGQV